MQLNAAARDNGTEMGRFLRASLQFLVSYVLAYESICLLMSVGNVPQTTVTHKFIAPIGRHFTPL